MFAASEPIAGADTPLNIVLGVGVLLLFAGILIRALAAQHRNFKGTSSLRALLRAMTPQTPSPDQHLRPPGAAPDRAGGELQPRPPSAVTSRAPEPAAVPRVEAPDRPSSFDLGPSQSSPCTPKACEPELARLSLASVRRLGRTLDESRRLHAAQESVAGDLAALPEGLWLVERDVQLGLRRIPFLVMGDSGIFVICATDGAWTLHDLHVLSELGDDLRRQLPDFHGSLHAAVCLAFDETKPRAWFGGQGEHGRGGWVLGLNWLRRWMLSFGPDQGLRNGDIRRLEEASGPFWDRRSTARLPATRNVG